MDQHKPLLRAAGIAALAVGLWVSVSAQVARVPITTIPVSSGESGATATPVDLEAVGLGAAVPSVVSELGFVAASAGTFQLNASGEVAAAVIQVPKTGTADKFACRLISATNTPDNGLRYSFQDVSLTTGLPDGVVDQSATIAQGSVATGWLDPGTFGATRSVTRGDYLALVVDLPTFVAADDVAIGGVTYNTNVLNFPYGVSNTSLLPAQTPSCALHYNDNTWAVIPYVYPASNVTSLAYNSGTSVADEWGTAFSFSTRVTIAGIEVPLAVAAGADFEVNIYSGTTAQATETIDGNVTTSTAARRTTVLFPTPFTTTADTTYRLTLRPTTANSLTLTYMVLPNAEILRYAWEGGDNFWMTSRLDQGATWTDYNNSSDGFRRAPISLILSAF